MEKLTNYTMPENLNSLYEKEASSSIGLARDVAEKLNEVIDYVNNMSKDDLAWKQTQEGIIRKGVLYMKDNLVNSLSNLFRTYDDETIRSTILELYGEEVAHLKNLDVIVTPQMFGAKPNTLSDSIEPFEKAINSLGNDGGIVYFPKGTYLMVGKEIVIDKPNITLMGEGTIICSHGFRPKASNLKVIGLNFRGADGINSDMRAFMIDNQDAAEESQYISGFTFKDCTFENFFYSVCCVGGAYSYDGSEPDVLPYPVRDVVIENCYSKTYTDQNCGHFQCIQVENIAYLNNRTYGGTTASSYNVIKGNGYIRVIGNYDHNNTYASCEIENGSHNCVVANNTFKGKIWIDDSFDVVVNANTTDEGILITVGSGVSASGYTVVSNNTCKNIRCEQFGEYKGGTIHNINILGNSVNGHNTHGIWIHGNAVSKAKISNNFITGVNTNDIAIQRNEQLNCYIDGNFGNAHTLLIAGNGGKVFVVDNYNMTSSGNRDSLPASHLERSFNGLKVEDSNGDAWRINVNTSGQVNTTKY